MPEHSESGAAARGALRNVIFVLTHATLLRVWGKAIGRLAGEGVRLRVSYKRVSDIYVFEERITKRENGQCHFIFYRKL